MWWSCVRRKWHTPRSKKNLLLLLLVYGRWFDQIWSRTAASLWPPRVLRNAPSIHTLTAVRVILRFCSTFLLPRQPFSKWPLTTIYYYIEEETMFNNEKWQYYLDCYSHSSTLLPRGRKTKQNGVWSERKKKKWRTCFFFSTHTLRLLTKLRMECFVVRDEYRSSYWYC